MKTCIAFVMFLGLGIFTMPASAGIINVSGSLTSTLESDNVNYDTTISLSNSSQSTDGVGTFWFAWVPGKDFMVNNPISETTPSGWTANVTHAGATDGYAIQWVANSAANDIAPGSSLVFGFKSAETPTELAGNSPAFPTFPETTSTVYSAAPFSGDSERFVVATASVPEPSTIALLAMSGLAVFGFKRWKQ